jgi:hypothetical protein
MIEKSHAFVPRSAREAAAALQAPLFVQVAPMIRRW